LAKLAFIIYFLASKAFSSILAKPQLGQILFSLFQIEYYR